MLENLKKAVRDREMVTVGGGEFSPQEVLQFVQEYQRLAGRDRAARRAERIQLIAAALPCAIAAAWKEIPTTACMDFAARIAGDQADTVLAVLDKETTE